MEWDPSACGDGLTASSSGDLTCHTHTQKNHSFRLPRNFHHPLTRTTSPSRPPHRRATAHRSPLTAAAACPGTPACSGHGKCLSLRALGEEPNAEPVGPPRPYGGDPEGATWDEDKIQGCACDSAWAVGYAAGAEQLPQWWAPDCTLLRCPSGDDPRTYGVDETDCELFDDNGRVWKGIVGSDGKRYRSAGALPGGVTIATPASCTPGVDCGARGNKCHVDCSNRGVCDHTSGTCTCFTGYYGVNCGLKSTMG
jgi:hypothetical protein